MSSQVINISGSINGNIITSDRIVDSFNKTMPVGSKKNEDLYVLLALLMSEIRSLSEKIPANQKDTIALILRDAHYLIAEHALDQPRKRRYQIYLEEIEDRAMALGSIAQRVLAITGGLKNLLGI